MKRAFLIFSILIPIILAANEFAKGIRFFKTKNYTEAKKAFEKAIEKEKSINAHYFLGIIYLKGLGTKKSPQKARVHLEKAAESGNARAFCYLGEIAMQIDKDKKRARKLLKEGASGGAGECAEIAKKYDIKL